MDSVVAIVGDQPIKHSDVMRDLRTTAFLNQGTVETSLEAQQAAVNRLVDQAIIRAEMKNGGYSAVDQTRIDQFLNQIQRRYPSAADFQRALASFGLTQATLRSQLAWQLAVQDFIELRFEAAPDDSSAATDDGFIRWLDTARKGQRVTIRAERLK